MASIVFVGSEGCGKTVLVTVFSKLYHSMSERGLALTPLNFQTAEYIERAWQALKKSEWPPSTPPGMRSQLEWQCRFANGSTTTVRLVDTPGQDLRQVFADISRKAWEELPTALQELAELVQSADVVVFLVNLRDFWGEGDPMKRLNNEWLLRGAMDYRTRHRPSAPMCLVFTQGDLYAEELKTVDIRKYAAKWLPSVAGIYFIDDRVPIFVVSAVGGTTIAIDENGKPQRFPDGKIVSRGFVPLGDWLIETIANQPRAHYATENCLPLATATPTSQPQRPRPTSAATASTAAYASTASKNWPTFSDADVSKFFWGVLVFIAICVMPMIRSCNQRAEQKKDLDKIIKDVQGR